MQYAEQSEYIEYKIKKYIIFNWYFVVVYWYPLLFNSFLKFPLI